VQVLHASELRLRLKAFLQHFQQCGASSNNISSSSSGGGGGGSLDDDGSGVTSAADEAIQTAFVNAVASVLAEQDASLASGQVNKLQQRQRGCPVSLLQLLAVHRGMAGQLERLAELCSCTVHEYVNTQTMYLTGNVKAACGNAFLPPPHTSSSSSMNWHLLRQAHNPQQARALAAGLQAAAEAAYNYAVPWPEQGCGAAAVQLAWAPSTWQLRQGLTGGHVLLERLYAGAVWLGAWLRLSSN
jgi:hypothetical protein